MHQTPKQNIPRVLIIGVNYEPEVTGIAPYTTAAAEHLASKNPNVSVITGMPHYPEWKVLPEHAAIPLFQDRSGVSLRRVKHYVPQKPSPLGRIKLELSFAIRAVLTPWRNPDVIVCVSPPLIASAMILLKASMLHRHAKTAVWVQDIYSKGIEETTSAPTALKKLLLMLEGMVFRSANKIIVIHERFKRTVESSLQVHPTRITVVRNWTHLDTPSEPIDPRQARQNLNWPDTDTVILHAGNMGAKQGLENVVNAARIADSINAPVRFVLLGNGNQRERLEQMSTGIQRIQFMDSLSNDEFSTALAGADIFLLNEKPSVSDMAVPSKLTTYFAARRPILAATHHSSASAEEIRASGGGLIINPDSPEELVEAALKLRANPDQCQQLAQSGSDYRIRTLAAEASLERLEELVNSLSDSR